MDEEQMWKGFYEKLQETKMNPPTEHESRVQDADGGFFEKFGSLLRQKSNLDETYLNAELAPLSQVLGEECKGPDDSEDVCVADDPHDAEAYDLERDMDIPDRMERKEEFIEKAFGMNIEDLYEEILFEIYNNIGCESVDVCTEDLVEFVQDAFKIPNERHDEIAEVVKKKEPPKIRLNVEIIKAENLLPKDPNGQSDPFVTLYLESNSSHRYNSSVKSATLNPIWEEHFSIPIVDSPRNEVLIVEVWDFDAAETVREKVHKLFDVKGVKGLSKLMKEIALTASTGKHDNEFIGRSAITLRSIPVSGITVWYNLEKGVKIKSRGSVLVNLTLSAEKNKHVAIQEHRHLLRLLLMYELETSQVVHYWWSGKFNAKAEAIRSQHSVQSGLSPFDCALSQWSVYASIHEEHPLSFSLFNAILETLLPVLRCMQDGNDDFKVFWDGMKRILPSCFSVIRKIRSKNVSDKHIIKNLSEVLNIAAAVKSLGQPADIDLFPRNIYGWTTRDDGDKTNDDEDDNDATYDIERVIGDAIHSGTQEWLEHIVAANRPASTAHEHTDEESLQYLIKIIQMVRSDLQRAIEYFDKHFYQQMRLNYSATLFRFYDTQLTEICKSIVIGICGSIKRLDIPDDQFQSLPNIDEVNMGTTLFELYLVLKRFVVLGRSLCPNDELIIETFYSWFMPGVTHWLDISIVKALTRIQKAIDLDRLTAVDETVKYSSSAVDTLTIFYQIKIFWQQLDWPDAEGSYTFVAKIVDDICRCCIFYARRMSARVEDLTMSDANEPFIVTTEWCLAINNIDYIRQSLPSFIKELDTDGVIQRLGEFRSSLEADRCAVTLKNVVENAVDIQRNQIIELIEYVSRKMAPPIRRFLAEGAEVLHEDSNSMEKLMLYLEESLATLYKALNEVNFSRILDAIWNDLSIIMYGLIQSNLDKRRPPAFFQNLRQTLHVMISCFKMGNIVSSDVEVLNEVERILDLHAFETADLIHQYYLERMGHQKECAQSDYGQLTIRAYFTDSTLELYVMNARNLVPMDSNGSCDPFVKAHFLPVNRFGGVAPVKTAAMNKTRFPLYDEHFKISLTPEQITKQNNLILFSIKDKDLFGMTNQYIAECYITFADIIASDNDQIHMQLSRPEYIESDTLKALEYRLGDKQAKEFVKKLKSKSYT